ncbi:MAG: hypothetical protein HC868_06185 [Sphingomonadales bacterium]|nr:hypothetical protein [Sphingomonadales bacterium]
MASSARSLGIVALAMVCTAALPAMAQQSSAPAKQKKPAPAQAKGGSVAGSWAGAVTQPGSKPYSIVMTRQASGGETDYPDLQCGGKLTRAGSAGGYTFFLETITRGRLDKGGRCIDGSITVTMAGAQLAWGWVGIHNGQTLVAHASLKRR